MDTFLENEFEATEIKDSSISSTEALRYTLALQKRTPEFTPR